MASIVPGYEYDIFISYRHNDNRSGWVTDFVKSLLEELAATIKEPVSVYFDTNPHDGLLETHNIDKSLEGKLECLIFIPIISQTYCDPKSFAWQHEFCAFNKLAKEGQLGRDIKLSNGNVTSRILPIKIHDLDAEDKATIENEIGGVLRAIEFIYKEAGVNRPLKPEDKKEETLTKTAYRNQVNKTANAIKEIINGLRNSKALPKVESIPKLSILQPSRKKITLTAATIALLGLLSFCYYYFGGFGIRIAAMDRSIAVLPFTDLSPEHDQEYFGIGVMDEILNHLTKIGDLSPVSRTSSMNYARSGKGVTEIAKELSVRNILEGTVSKSNGKFKITASLIDAGTDRNLWSKTYEREIGNLFEIESEVAQKVAQELSARVSPEVKKRIEKNPTYNQEAYDLFLRAHAKINSEENVIPILERVIELDSTFSRAYSDLATEWVGKGIFFGDTDPIIVKRKVKEYIDKALKLDSLNSDAYYQRYAFHLYWNWEIDSALMDIERGRVLNPSRTDLGQAYQLVFCASGRFKESLEKSLIYFNLDKNMHQNWIGLANSYFYNGQAEKAIETLEGATRFLNTKYGFDENIVVTELGQLRVFIGKYKEALQILEPMKSRTNIPWVNGYLGITNAKIGNTKKARELLSELHEQSLGSSVGSPCYFAAAVHTTLGESDMAIQFLEKAYKNREVEMFWLKVVPIFDPLRKDPRFLAILKKVGFK